MMRTMLKNIRPGFLCRFRWQGIAPSDNRVSCTSRRNKYVKFLWTCLVPPSLTLYLFAAFVKPYIFSVFPAGTVPTPSPVNDLPPSNTGQAQPSFNTTAVVQIRSSLSLQVAQTLPFPFDASEVNATQNALVRLMTPSAAAKAPLFVLTTPIDKVAAANEGSSIWQVTIKSWSEQIDELVLAGQYSDALALLDSVEESQLPDKVSEV